MTTPSEWARVRTLFHDAMERPPAERAAFARAHASDPAVVSEVESLLAAAAGAEGFLSTPPAGWEPIVEGPRLAAGGLVGPFEIAGLVGAGGMGEVYRARDTRLGRDVAVKVLSSDLARRPNARERLEREARVVSRLTHPHVCTLYDVGVASVGGVETQYLVMEFVEGDTLAARLRRGAMPLAQALLVASETLEALAAAHELGIVHRDLKPGNIMLTKSGVKLLDFGLARLVPPDANGGSVAAAAGEPLTQEGLIVGTVPYMAPEQVRGEPADARSDLFAFGAVLYEMITGARAFEGHSQAELVAAILERDPPPLTSRQPHAPANLERVVSTCLAKSPEDRWVRARDVRRELAWIRADGERRPVPASGAPRTAWRWLAASLIMVTGLLAAAVWRRDAPPSPRQVHFTVAPPKGTTFPRASAEIAVSPDGLRLAFVALSANGTPRLWLRPIDAVDARPLEGTEGASLPFWSPDGRSLGFFTRDKLVRIDDNGGARQELADVLVPRGGSWHGANILFASNSTLKRVAATGGTVSPVTAIDASRKERAHAWPAFLPDGRGFLYASLGIGGEESSIYQGTLGSTRTERVLAGAQSFVLAGTHLLSLNNRALVVQTFDPHRGQVERAPIPLASGVGLDVRRAQGAFAAHSNVLAYRLVNDQSRLQWFDRQGHLLRAFHESGDYQHPWLSPDETQVAVEKTDPASGRHTLWLLDVNRDITTRLLADPSGAHGPLWSFDGRRMLFASNRFGGVDIFSVSADGTGDQALVLRSPEKLDQAPTDWSRDQSDVLYTMRGDIWVLTLGASEPRVFLQTPANELQARFSPDGRWVAYTSDESGVPEIYIRRYPGGQDKWRVSMNGGAQAQWRADGKELFYLAADGRVMATDVKANGSALKTGPPQSLFDTGVRGLFVERRNHYVVTRDGQRFLVNVTPPDDSTAPITVVLNWDSALRH